MDERYETREEGRARNSSEQDQEENAQDEVQSAASSRSERWTEKCQSRERKESDTSTVRNNEVTVEEKQMGHVEKENKEMKVLKDKKRKLSGPQGKNSVQGR